MRKYFILMVLFFICGTLTAALPTATQALSGSQFKAGNIINDGIFFNSGAMTASQIQNFLNSKVPSCDTNGTKMHSSGRTRAEHGRANGAPPPYKCLKDYKQNTPTRNAESGLCGYLGSKSNRSAANIINDVAKACGISQKSLIVLLQKEQGLVTDEWPWPRQYRSATGYGCPDTAPCDSEYYGFFNQVYSAARQFKRYAINENLFNYHKNRNNYIQYNPNASCGGSNVYIQNQATAGLYNYTPYQPNPATLAVGLGATAHCGAYGNKNFWWYHNIWFGSTNYGYAAEMVSNKVYADSGRTNEVAYPTTVRSGVKLYATITAKNTGSKTWHNSYVRIGTRSPHNHASPLADNSWLSSARPASLVESSVEPGETGTFRFTLTAPNTDKTYVGQFQIIAEGVAWMEDSSRFDTPVIVSNPYNAQLISRTAYSDAARTKKIHNSIGTNDTVYWRIKAKNIGTSTWNQSTVRIGTRDPDNRTSDFRNGSWLSVARPTRLLESTVTPGAIGTFDYTMTGPNSEGILNETFGIVAEGIAWMPAPNYSDSFRVTHTLDRLLRNQRLVAGTDLRNSGYRLVMQGDGNLVVYDPQGKAKWNSGTRGGNRFIMQGDGNLVMYNGANKAIWSSGTKGGNRFIMQGDGSLVVYNGSGKAIWSARK